MGYASAGGAAMQEMQAYLEKLSTEAVVAR
jgi:hypothetical protein